MVKRVVTVDGRAIVSEEELMGFWSEALLENNKKIPLV